LLRQLVNDQRFAFADVILVIASGVVGIVKPELVFWFILTALLPWILRLLAGKSPFRRTAYDWLFCLFILTALGGYFVAYDRVVVTQKLFYILISVLLFYALIGQPENNYSQVIFLFWGIGIVVCLYYFLTYNFVQNSNRFEFLNQTGARLMGLRSYLNWSPIPSGYIPGLVVITTCFMFIPLADPGKSLGLIQKSIIYFGDGLLFLTLCVVKSRSIWMALFSAMGIWFLWKIVNLKQFPKNTVKWFPWIVFLYLFTVIILVYTVGPASSANPNDFGTNSRLEVFVRSISFVGDFPVTGAGLASFPGLYSNYILAIPYFYFPNSYNIFLDVAIEQGLIAGMIFLILQGFGIYYASRTIQRKEARFNNWLALFALMFAVVHGLTQDYLYNAAGTMLLFFPLAMSIMLSPDSRLETPEPAFASSFTRRNIQIISVLIATVVTGTLIFNFNRFLSVWYSNLGSLQLAKVELRGFPEAGWPGIAIIPKLSGAKASLETSLRLDHDNLTANHHLGLIFMLNRDFEAASHYLVIAHAKAPEHRGITKSLGYCYVWLGELDKAQLFLADIPESKDELDAYTWWWKNQGRTDLSEMAYTMIDKMNSAQVQP